MTALNSESHIISRDKNGKLDTVMVRERIKLETRFGTLVPRYSMDEHSRKKEAPVKFHKNEQLKSVPLEDATEIKSPIGNFKAELVTFYLNGALRRLFPLNGKLSGYWTELNEYNLAEKIDIPSPVGTISVKPIYIQFFESGELQSIVFWPREEVTIDSTVGRIKIRKGISFYKNGSIEGFEPAAPVLVESPIGPLKVFDPDPNGLNAERHSLCFYENGEIRSVITSGSQVAVMKDGMIREIFSPGVVSSYCDESAFFISPLKIIFEQNHVVFMDNNTVANRFPKTVRFAISDFIPGKPIAEIMCE